MTPLPTLADLATLDDEQLEALAVAWRTRALQGDKSANGMAHALDVERRRRLRESQVAELEALAPEGAAQPGGGSGNGATMREARGTAPPQGRGGGGQAPVLRSRKAPPRKLHRGHFAFMRALAQGLDEKASWDRYLRSEGEGADLRTIRRTVAWIRDEFAAAARRESRPGTAKLILLDPKRFTDAPALPTLEEFAAERGLEDFSASEQIEAYEAAYPSASSPEGAARAEKGKGAQVSRRARLIEHQLNAINWLQGLVVGEPRPQDPVTAWIQPAIAERLQRAGIGTLADLVAHINAIGARWWVPVTGVGEHKAQRVVAWLQGQEGVLGPALGAHVAKPRAQLAPHVLEDVVPKATALVPLEKFIVPAELDGRAGRLRRDPQHCTLNAHNDYEAIQAWLAAKRPSGDGRRLSATQRSYRKEAERLLLWSVLERKKALSSLTVEDATAFKDFLTTPPAHWCGPRHHQRWSPLWRPLEGPLSSAALRQAMVIVRGLFSFLVSQAYLVANPFAAEAPVAALKRPLGSRRSLSFTQWDHIEQLLLTHGETEPARRLRRAMRWLYATGLRLAEITNARCADLEQVEYYGSDGALAKGWMLHVVGKGQRTRQVPVPAECVKELGDELLRHNFDSDVSAQANAEVAILARFKRGGVSLAWSASGLYQAIKAFFAVAGEGRNDADAKRIRQASTHWLRHMHASHALQGRGGRPAVPIQVVQNNLGHVSVGTTSKYLLPERDERIRTMSAFWGHAEVKA